MLFFIETLFVINYSMLLRFMVRFVALSTLSECVKNFDTFLSRLLSCFFCDLPVKILFSNDYSMLLRFVARLVAL